ncbi:RNA exonuclease 1 homolog isoform X1 [Pollicipes pollicipes]|uniref:RNA exonuclease 1 homolog isoform X1 n=1 Tax=Pollicipes pollicipes TaxID=41117 RepID=UPI0018854771|nr:RNA exonuclease 1 homolog isoform X1 [Pollicipes pollicipes]
MLCEPLIMSNSLVERRRVAHVPNVGALLQKPSVAAAAASTSAAADTKTVTTAQTAPKGGKRLAHTPSTANLARPKIPAEFGGKVPTAIRQRYLDHFCTDLLKVYPGNEAQAYKKALEEEQAVYNRSPSRRVYVNLAVGSVKRLRDAAAAGALRTHGTWIVFPHQRAMQDLTNVYGRYAGGARPPPPPPLLPLPPPHNYLVYGCPPTDENFYVFHPLQLQGYESYGGVTAGPVPNRTVSHLDILAGKGGASGSWSIERNKKVDEIKSDSELYQRLQPYVLTEEQLEQNGFPRADALGRPGRARLAHVDSRARITRAGASCRECLRCNRTYAVADDGRALVEDQCVYHWGRVYTRRGDKRYSCCSQEAPADGCCVAACHVSDNFDPDNLVGYMATMDKPEPADGNHGVFALDCEMSYTQMGGELTRITVINSDGDTVYESLVKPDSPVIDFNTRFSGIKEEDMEGVDTTIRDVQAVLLNMFSSKTILIGHSLESDFKALKLIHSTVVDTSVVFPHKMGRPYKRALRNLCSDHLKRIIQNDVGGHDSAEDAVSCMDLMLWKLKEDAKSLR